MPLTNTDRVCIVWRDGSKDTTVNTLIYRPEHKVRTYEPDGMDPRAAAPLLTDPGAIRRHLATKFGYENSIAVPVTTAMRLFGWKQAEFADI